MLGLNLSIHDYDNPSASHTYNISIQNYSDVVSNESPSIIQLEDTPTTSNYITIIK